MGWLDELKRRPWATHLLRAVERYSGRLGSQSAAGIAYFSVLSMVPVLMFAFAMVGMTVTVFRPDWLAQLQALINEQFNPATDLGAKIGQIVENALSNWGALGGVALVTAAWSGASWVGNLKAAVRAQWRSDFDVPPAKVNPVLEVAKNLGILLVIFLGVATTFVASSVATALADWIFGLLSLDRVPGGGFLLRSVPILVSLGFGVGLFLFLFTVLPESKEPRRTMLIGSLLGSLGLAALQYFTSGVIGLFSGSPTAQLFGPVIALMLFFNLFATLILVLAAWIATAEPPTVASEPEPGPVEEATAAGPPVVSEAVARKAMGVGLGTGYVIGTATGVGLGAVVTAALTRVVAAISRRRG